MEKQCPWKLFFGKWNTMTLIAIAVGAIVFGLLMVLGNVPLFSGVSLSMAMFVPVIIGAFFGAVPAFFALFMGSIAMDMLIVMGMNFDYAVGFGVLGLFVGALPMYGARVDKGVFTLGHAVVYVLFCVVGQIVAFGLLTPFLTSTFYYYRFWGYNVFESFIENIDQISVLVVLGAPLLYVIAKINKRDQFSEHIINDSGI